MAGQTHVEETNSRIVVLFYLFSSFIFPLFFPWSGDPTSKDRQFDSPRSPRSPSILSLLASSFCLLFVAACFLIFLFFAVLFFCFFLFFFFFLVSFLLKQCTDSIGTGLSGGNRCFFVHSLLFFRSLFSPSFLPTFFLVFLGV